MKILIVDDDRQIVASLQEALEGKGKTFDCAFSGREAVEKIRAQDFDIVILDLVLPELNGLEVLEQVAKEKKQTRFIMVTGFGSIETAINAMKIGASDYLTKPINLDELRMLVERTREQLVLEQENRKLKDMLGNKDPFRELIGTTQEMLRVKEVILQVAPKKVTVLIQGESGTGKELVANAIYNHSNRTGKPFLKINCGALSQGILESELFGHEKGSFTGAVGQKKGIFEAAHGGTIFLDEIGELPFEFQVRLLRVLETGEFTRVGGVETLRSNARIVAATNKDLEEEVQAGRFREDLFYRLNVITVRLPPLRERLDDIPFLVKRFIELYNIENNTEFSGVSMEVLDFLMTQPWKGNVRELRNEVEKILVFASHQVIEMADLPDDLLKKNVERPANEYQGTMAEIERRVIDRTMRQTDGNVRRVSHILDIPLRTLYRKLKHYDIGSRQE